MDIVVWFLMKPVWSGWIKIGVAVSILVAKALVIVFKYVLIKEIGRWLEGWVGSLLGFSIFSAMVAIFMYLGIVEVDFISKVAEIVVKICARNVIEFCWESIRSR